jgi:hypothetical protein
MKTFLTGPDTEDGWDPVRVEMPLRALCSEIGESIAAVVLRRWVLDCTTNSDRLGQLFVLAVRLKPHITDSSDLGVYSKSARSRIYRSLAERMPKLLMLAAYSPPSVVRSLENFMDHWELAEEHLTDVHVGILDNLDGKDRGAFLYWMLNERTLPTRHSHSFLALACACPWGCDTRFERLWEPGVSLESARLIATQEQRRAFVTSLELSSRSNLAAEKLVSNGVRRASVVLAGIEGLVGKRPSVSSESAKRVSIDQRAADRAPGSQLDLVQRKRRASTAATKVVPLQEPLEILAEESDSRPSTAQSSFRGSSKVHPESVPSGGDLESTSEAHESCPVKFDSGAGNLGLAVEGQTKA